MRRAPFSIVLGVLGCTLAPACQATPTASPVTSFTISASPNPVGQDTYTTITAVVGGSAAVPDGSVDFYISSSATACSADTNDLGTVTLDGNGAATLLYYPYSSGTFPICANYIPGSSGVYLPAQAGVYLLMVNQPTVFSVSVPGAALPGTPLTFTFNLTSPVGQTPPTGTITLEDPNNGYTTLGTANVDQYGNVTNSVTATLAGNSWYAVYNGDSNYSAQYVSGQVLLENSLSSVTPAAITAGSPDTNVTLTGLGFTASSQPLIVLSDSSVNLPVNSFTSTQIQTTIPAAYLATAGPVSIEVVTGSATGGPIQLQVYTPFTVTPTVSATPSTFTYGSTALTTFAASLARGAPADAAVPAGNVSFTLTPTGGGSSVSLGSAQLSQVSTPGAYSAGGLQLIDTNDTGKLISADLNGDGYTDVIGLPASSYGYGALQPYLQVWLSTGANAFESEQQVYVGCTAQDFAVGDINGDGIPDIVVVCTSNYDSSGATTLQAFYVLGNGDGTFQAPVPFGGNSSISTPTQVVLGDFDGDGKMDVAAIDGYNGYVQVLFGASPFGSFNAGPVVYFDTSNGQVVAAGAADFNQDGLSDIALEEYSYGGTDSPGAVLTLISQGVNGFTQQSETQFFATTNYMQSMAITDVNGDGYPDVVVADPGELDSDDSGNLFIFENDQNGNLPLTLDYPAAAAGAVAGPPFPVIGQPPASAATAPGWNLVYTGTPNGYDSDYFVTTLQRQDASTWNVVNSTDTGLYIYQTEGGPVPDFVVTGDMNGDGYLDFALNALDANYNYQMQPWYYGNDAQASFTGSSTEPVPGSYTLNLAYPGNQLFTANTASTPVTILPATPTGSISGPANSQYGSQVQITANVQGVAGGALPGGTVTFYDGSTPIETDTLIPGEAYSSVTLQTTQLTAGLHTINVSYSGDGNYSAAPNFAYLQILVAGTPVTLSLTSSTSSTTAGAMVTFQVQASGNTLPAGEIITLTGVPTSANVTPVINAGGVATYSYGLFAPGTYTIQASYAGDSTFAPATSNILSLQVSSTPVTVALASSANPVTYPAPIGLTADVSSGGLGIPTGSIAFQNNGATIASGTLATVNGSSGLLRTGSFANNGLQNIAMVTGDFNHDGNQDIAALQSYQGTVSLAVMLGNGDGTFQAPVIYGSSAGVDPTSVAIAAADFNGDGYTDLVIAASDGAVTTFIATGDAAGDLALGQLFQIPAATAVATGDFLHTGHPGFVVAGSNSVSVWFGTGGAFAVTPSWTYSSETGSYTGVVVADFAHNNTAGIAVSDASGPDAAVFLYSPTLAGFSGPQTYGVGVSAGAIAAGDVNGDGYPDLAVLSPSDSTVAILLNNGSGGFLAATTYGVSTQPNALAIADFNQDGYSDVAVSGSNAAPGAGTTILLGSSSGAITGEASLPQNPGQSIVTADFNNDGNPDLAVGSTTITPFVDSSAQASTANVALTAGTAPLTAAYSPSDGSTFAAGSSSTLNEVVNQAASTIVWTAPASIVYGTPLSGTQLDASSTVLGAFTYTPALGTVLTAGTQTLSVTFAPTDAVDYLPATASVSINVTQAPTSITWTNPSGIIYGTALGSSQLDATASVPGTFAYAPAAGAILRAGTHTLTVAFTPTDATDYQPSTARVSIVVSQATPTISWTAPAAITYGTPLGSAQLNATPSVPGSLAYSPASGTTLTAGTHTLSVTLTPTDATDYTSASASVSLLVNQATPVITWSNPASITYGTALGNSQLDATASVPGAFTYAPAAGTILTAGTHTLSVTFTPTDTTDYKTTTASVSIAVSQATPTISWTAPAAITYGTPLGSTQLSATASVPGTLAYNPAAGAVLTAGPHSLSVTLTPNDATDYATATASVSILVNQATPEISWTAPAAITYGTPLGSAQLSATASVPGTLAYSPASGTTLTAGTHTLGVTLTPSDATDYTTATASVSILVNQATPVITWANPAPITYGTLLSATQLDATATPSGGTFAYSPPAGTTLAIGTQTLSVLYTPTDTTDYTTASDSVTIQIISGLALTSIQPSSAPVNSPATTITLTGTGFTSTSTVQLNGSAIPSVYLGPTQMTATLPATFFAQTGTGAITVTNPQVEVTTPAVDFTVTPNPVQVTLSGPATVSPGDQPSITFTLLQPYPQDLQGTFTLTIQPPKPDGPVDPAVQFSTGGDTLNFTIPANSVTTPTVQIQAGTLAATITITLTLEANGQDVTPADLQPVVIQVPAAPPVISSVAVARSGDTLTVTVQGFSSTRTMSSATFVFAPAAGSTLSNSSVKVDVGSAFADWYAQTASQQYGSAFSYTQTFQLSNDASTIGSVTVTLTNSVGTSNARSAN